MRLTKQPVNTLSSHQIQKREYRLFDAQGAQAILPMVRKLTQIAVGELDPVQKKLNNMVPADPRNLSVNLSYEKIVMSWAGKMERLGLKVHGLWQVGFDCGDGWLGWQHPERSVRYFLEYDALFSDKHLIESKRESGQYVAF